MKKIQSTIMMLFLPDVHALYIHELDIQNKSLNKEISIQRTQYAIKSEVEILTSDDPLELRSYCRN